MSNLKSELIKFVSLSSADNDQLVLVVKTVRVAVQTLSYHVGSMQKWKKKTTNGRTDGWYEGSFINEAGQEVKQFAVSILR